MEATFLVLFAGLPLAYLALQLTALWRWQGGYRKAATLPLVA